MRIFFTFFLAFLGLASANAQGYKPGDRAIDFRLKNIDGKMVSLADNKKAKGAIVVFTCNHCPYSQAYEQRIIDLHKRWAAKGYPVVAINPNDPRIEREDSYVNMQRRAKAKGYPFPYLVDETQQIARSYGATRTPHVYVLRKNAKGGFEVMYVGAIDDNTEDATAATAHYVDDAVTALLDNKTPEVATTKAVGCTIKWRK
jgi:peroxiredoxin